MALSTYNKDLLKFMYNLTFTPKTCEWEFNLEKYKEKLTPLSP